MKELCVQFDLQDDKYFTALRLVAGAICNLAQKDVDSSEDFKVCVSESALILKNNGYSSVKALFSANGGAQAVICGEGKINGVSGDNELSLALIGALVDSCDFKEEDGVISSVTLKI